jgi:hypothetical protein
MNSFSSAISGVGSAVGRYFSIVSFIPSLFLVGFTFALIESNAWSGKGSPDWTKAGNSFTHIGNLAFLVLVSMAIGVAVHPVQFALVQFFEGYWGTGRLAQRVRLLRILHHRNRASFLQYHLKLHAQLALQGEEGPLDTKAKVEYLSMADESDRLIRGYPIDDDEIMPTRLGNVLRRYERLAGSQYGLDAVRVIRQVALGAPAQRVSYLNDQRQLLDLSIRMSATSIAATLVAIAFLWRHGPWLLIALVPYGIAYLSYRGAVVVAHEYGAAISAIIDLDRFTLYDNLRVGLPKDTEAERRMNDQLMKLLGHNRFASLSYENPQVAMGADTEPEAR